MIKYTDITFEEIDRMTLAELNKYIAEYGKVLIQRTQRIYASRESTERTRALKPLCRKPGTLLPFAATTCAEGVTTPGRGA